MSTPFSFVANFNLPGTPGLPDQPIPVNFLGQYDKKAEFELTFTGSGTQTVNLGSIVSPGAKLLILLQDAMTNAQVVLVKPNASLTALEVAPGGGVVWFNPTPVAGLTSLAFDFTAPGKVRVWVLG